MITKKGSVVKKSGDKTVKVQVHTYVLHPKYKKRYRITKNYLVHDEANSAVVGQQVSIAQYRRVSKKKSWVLVTDSAA